MTDNLDNTNLKEMTCKARSNPKQDSRSRQRYDNKDHGDHTDRGGQRRNDRNNNRRNGGRNGNRGDGHRNNRKKDTEKNEKIDEPSVNIIENNKEFDLPNEIDDFEDMEFLPENVLTSIYDYGFKFPSPVQARSIHIINGGHDMIVQSDSGTGKTGAFTIGALSLIDPKIRRPQCIIIANTHPLANQILIVVSKLAAKMGIDACLCVGGGTRPEQNAKIARKSHILIGTPGRMKDIALRNVFKPNDIKILIMDEADELLKRDFRENIQDIVSQVSERTQICTFSATYTESSYEMAKNGLMKNPYEIVIKNEELSTDRIQQYNLMLPSCGGNQSNKKYNEWKMKMDVLIDLANTLSINQAIIFTNHIDTALNIRNELMRKEFTATDVVTSDTDPMDREKILCQFRLGQIKFLISTDLISRGIDIDDLRCVINFDFPKSAESYIHRIGRSGRFGGNGIAINIMTYKDNHLVTDVKSYYNVHMDNMPNTEYINSILTDFDPPSGKASSAQNYKVPSSRNYY